MFVCLVFGFACISPDWLLLDDQEAVWDIRPAPRFAFRFPSFGCRHRLSSTITEIAAAAAAAHAVAGRIAWLNAAGLAEPAAVREVHRVLR